MVVIGADVLSFIEKRIGFRGLVIMCRLFMQKKNNEPSNIILENDVHKNARV
jgi:hypothetical protein